MKLLTQTLGFLILTLANSSCSSPTQDDFTPKEVYRSEELIITQLTEDSFEHISFLQTEDFGNVPCNGLIVRNSNEVIIFDTPTGDKSSEELIKWIQDSLHSKINAVIPTHFHEDCLGGLEVFDNYGIPSYASVRTIELAEAHNYALPNNSFMDSLTLQVGKEVVVAKFFGEGHTRDNVIGYFPAEKILFGGCLLKELGATKGYLGDSNVEAWSTTVGKIKEEYPDVKIIVPGHGKYGDKKLLDYTIDLFKTL